MQMINNKKNKIKMKMKNQSKLLNINKKNKRKNNFEIFILKGFNQQKKQF